MSTPYIKLLALLQGRYGVLHSEVNDTGVGDGDENVEGDGPHGSDETEGRDQEVDGEAGGRAVGRRNYSRW